ncbi:MAG: glycoside hydrolase family 127 protein [Ignavibacteriae bacterium]|nr:glycoside hydrolase family 127 protein [Ignavibacteriota bacterium]
MKPRSVISVGVAALVALTSAWMNTNEIERSLAGQRFSKSHQQPIHDFFSPASPADVTITGTLGKRCEANVTNWLLKKNEDSLLVCYTHRPGSYGYQGEHVGKWIDAATRAWANTRNTQLRAKLDRVVKTLLSTQLEDGYLGTYPPGDHWSRGRNGAWDVWVHKYNLIGLLTYANLTGNAQALAAAQRIGDLIVATFGDPPKLNLNTNAPHQGMASGSILGPMVRLYQATNEERYLQFAINLVERWEGNDGPKLVSSLTDNTPVSLTANGKAYEMLSCLNGLCELYRATGNKKYLVPVLNAWQDIVDHQLLPTGGGSQGEFWFANDVQCREECDGLAEICVTWNWMELNMNLLRLSGDVQYADEIERTVCNQLAAAQKLDGSGWAYFTNLRGRRVYSSKQTCCSSNGPRAIASLPSYVFLRAKDGIVVNLLENSASSFVMASGERVKISQETDYPLTGKMRITVSSDYPTEFTLYVRVPSWSSVAGLDSARRGGRFEKITRIWKGSSSLLLDFAVPFRVESVKPAGFQSRVLMRGPEMLVRESRLPTSNLRQLGTQSGGTLIPWKSNTYLDRESLPVYSVIASQSPMSRRTEAREFFFVPFSIAGRNGSDYNSYISQSQLEAYDTTGTLAARSH